ncbi:MAG: threonine-phosphate decarboxylase CobD [Brasilonema octagenarum HA4186-MV1]|jgi:L-threonine-O-3-phosphate decarboxylase|uniref:threonine-phosphate decarboxylase n=2 Tax=Brasilonema TaxID=383614 RepID=A0A856MM74_9CYAN|nr:MULTISPECIES: threonine-phosphate decarboxylase CobD [Brasilonema]MBW4624940.1 threonine-phosphate decarboxylase CobD [Brasilonema octagenarum HA4186-MV1]NMF62284.1 threonine-phosphate decarboxylase [Brasilonema octagenarum UFV-OR1]QDL10297.1 threonine-phosphate decarboxylase [Brasilonema sennae CENA114]QDL16647.1 threonine-phosphate decarboxylase [Brasilonema octagenarum UFV-E1]
MRQPAHGGNLAWAAALAGCPPSAILDFSASISPLGPPKSAIAAIESQLDHLRHYPDPDYGELRLALSHFHQLPPEWILPGNGSAELLSLAGRDLAQLAATALITPAFGDYYRALAAYHAKVLEFSLLVFRTLSLIFDKVENTKDKGLLLNNPHNPTGVLFSREAILPYLEKFALVVVDEAFMDFLPPGQEQSLIEVVQEYPNLVILRSLTKFYSLPGLRLGYAIAHPERLRRWQSWRDPWPVNTLAAAAAVAVVQDKEFQEQTWAWLPPARNQLFAGLASMPGLQPLESAANFLLVESQQSSSQLQQNLLQHHQIFIRDCLSFPELGDRYFRVAVRSWSDNQRLLEALSLVINH